LRAQFGCADANLNPFLFPSIREYMECSSQASRHPLRNESKKAHYVAIDHNNVFQIQNDVAAVRFEVKKSPQLGYRRCFDSAAQDEIL